jgi:hypothetical protein
MGNVKKFKGANNTIMVKDVSGKIVTNLAGGKLPPASNVVIGSVASNTPHDNLSIVREFEEAERLARLLGHRDWTVRLEAAETGHSYETLAALGRDPSGDVRVAVAGNNYTDVDTLNLLSRDEVTPVRLGVAANVNSLSGTLYVLTGDSSEAVSLAAVENLFVHNPRVAAMSIYTPGHLLDELSRSKDAAVRQEVADNPATPGQTLAHLAKSSHTQTHANVAGNQSTPPEVLEKMSPRSA